MENANEMQFALRRGVRNGRNFWEARFDGSEKWLNSIQMNTYVATLINARTDFCPKLAEPSNGTITETTDDGVTTEQEVLQVKMTYGTRSREFTFAAIDYLHDDIDTIRSRLAQRIKAVRAWEASIDYVEEFSTTLTLPSQREPEEAS